MLLSQNGYFDSGTIFLAMNPYKYDDDGDDKLSGLTFRLAKKNFGKKKLAKKISQKKFWT